VLAALNARSKLGQSDTDIDAAVPVPPDPLDGHESRRISLGGGIENGNPFIDTRIRPAMTDLVDMDYIHNQGAQIEFAMCEAGITRTITGTPWKNSMC